jgi:hypothetical protein
MNLPTATEIAALGALLGAAYTAFPILATVVGLIFLIKGAPVGIKWVKKAFG